MHTVIRPEVDDALLSRLEFLEYTAENMKTLLDMVGARASYLQKFIEDNFGARNNNILGEDWRIIHVLIRVIDEQCDIVSNASTDLRDIRGT